MTDTSRSSVACTSTRDTPGLRDDGDPRKLDLGIDAAGQRRHRVDAGDRHKDDAKRDRARVGRGETGDVHGLSGFSAFSAAAGLDSFAFSPRPYTDEVRTVCPSATPERISTASGF